MPIRPDFSPRAAVRTVAQSIVLIAAIALAAGRPALDDTAAAQEDPPTDPSELNIDVEWVVGGMTRLVGVTNAGDGSGRLFLLEKAGRVRIVVAGALAEEPFLDITDQVESSANERGLLGIAFHPNFTENGYFYINYTTASGGMAPGIGNGDTVISRFRVSSDDPDRADPDSESLVIAYEQPYGNHNGGHLLFGPDGYLYIGAGDGGSGGDPQNRAQNGSVLLGKMLRIDVDVDEGAEKPYMIPTDNPFIDDPDFEDEIWAYGLRNPWRYAFDSMTGDLYIADVGQGALEEVNFQPAESAGGENYGWRIMEGTRCFNPSPGCDMEGLVLPVAEYGRTDGVSVTGGNVYRGERFPRLNGTYFYADYGRSNVWGLNRDEAGEWRNDIVATFSFKPSSFGLGEDGEIYVVSDAGGNSALYHLVDADAAPIPTDEPTTPSPTPDPSAEPTTPPPTDEPTTPPSTDEPTTPPSTGEPTDPPIDPTTTPPPSILLPWTYAGQ